MSKKHIDYDPLLIVASNLTVAEVQATHKTKLPDPVIANYPSPENFVWDIFKHHVARLEKEHDTSADIL